MKVNFQFTFIFHFYFHCHPVQSERVRKTIANGSQLTVFGSSTGACSRGNDSIHGVQVLFLFDETGLNMSLNEIYEESVLDQPELRGTRIVPTATLVIGIALLTQLMVLSGVAIIMGIAVVTMCAFMVEIMVLMVVATVLERGIVNTEDLSTLMEITATLFITLTTITLASTSSGNGSSEKPTILQDGKTSEEVPIEMNGAESFSERRENMSSSKKEKCDGALDPQGKVYIIWLMFVTMAFVYNCWVIPLRSAFNYQTPKNIHKWMACDYTADFIYLLDLLFFKPRVMYLSDGFWIKDNKLTRVMYFHKIQFKMDVLSLMPLDLLCLNYGTSFLPFLRVSRFLKIQTFWEFYNRCDSVVASGYVVRVARTLTYMLYLIHLNACAYYAFSVWEGLGTNGWVFNGRGNAYIRCFYFATKTATSIGKNPKPENVYEYMFMTWSWLMGVFVFALLIGQIRDIIATATRNQTEYRKLVDETLEYMRRLNLPMKLQERVKLWFKFTWEQQHTFNEANILDTLPPKMKTDVAINVHIQALSKVQIFHDCDPALLRELVLKLQPVLFLPGDYICRKGEVGKQMYIVKTGVVEVLGDDDREVIATLKEGSVFGEISLLSLGAGNRRTASVRSGGFSNLFILNKYDLNEALVYYPDAQEILKNKAKKLMKENEERERQNRLKEQSEQSDDITDDTEDSTSNDEEAKQEGMVPTSKKSLRNSKLNQLVTTTTWLTTVTSVAIPEPIRNQISTVAIPDPVVIQKPNAKDVIECNVTVHKENCK